MTAPTAYATLTGDYTIDPTHSRLGFVARHAMVTKVRGAFNDFTGEARIDGENPADSSVTVTIQAASIDTRNAQRDQHLLTADFLQLEQYPTITFASTAVEADDDTITITGDLTIRGVTKQVTVPFSYEGQAQDPYGNTRIGFEGGTTISRKDFGITWNTTLETGGVLVGDKIVLEFEISAIKQG